jgi:hypothetical protein
VAEVSCILTLFWCYLFVDSIGMAAALKAFWNSPVGPKTTHFWGPVANWGFVVAVSLYLACSYLVAAGKRSRQYNLVNFSKDARIIVAFRSISS